MGAKSLCAQNQRIDEHNRRSGAEDFIWHGQRRHAYLLAVRKVRVIFVGKRGSRGVESLLNIGIERNGTFLSRVRGLIEVE